MWLSLSVGLMCAVHAHQSTQEHRQRVLEILEWSLGSVGSQSRHQKKHRPLLAMLGQLSLDLSRNRQTAASKTTPGSAGASSYRLPGWVHPASLSKALDSLRRGMVLNSALLRTSPPEHPASPRLEPLLPFTFLYLEPFQLQPHDPSLCVWSPGFPVSIRHRIETSLSQTTVLQACSWSCASILQRGTAISHSSVFVSAS